MKFLEIIDFQNLVRSFWQLAEVVVDSFAISSALATILEEVFIREDAVEQGLLVLVKHVFLLLKVSSDLFSLLKFEILGLTPLTLLLRFFVLVHSFLPRVQFKSEIRIFDFGQLNIEDISERVVFFDELGVLLL